MDPIADLLTRIRNGARARHRFVETPLSKIRLAIVKLLKKRGFIEGFLVKEEKPVGRIRIYLKYRGRRPLFEELKRESTPGKRVYVGRDEIPSVMSGTGIAVLSTSQGILDGHEAKEKGIGGELLCTIW